MIHLQCTLKTRWDAEPFIARLTTNSRLPLPLRSTQALLLEPGTPLEAIPEGFMVVVSNSGAGLESQEVVELPAALSYLSEGDIIRFSPRSGQLKVLYRKHSPSNVVFMTEQCNSNCLMCSQPPRKVDDRQRVQDYLKAIPLMARETVELGISGGEPTLYQEDLLNIIKTCRDYLPDTSVHLLSNGRLFSYLKYAKDIAAIHHPDLMIGIPLYSDIASMHEYVVQAKGAFDQTVRGILNLGRTGVPIEIRIVVHQQTYERLPHLARFIARNLPFVSHVTFMGMEMIGHTRMNLPALWIDPTEYQDLLEAAVLSLNRQRLYVSIYNHQLCVLKKSLWPFARKSISDWKNEYLDVCKDCAVKADCGGFFSSASLRYSDYIHPIKHLVSEGAS